MALVLVPLFALLVLAAGVALIVKRRNKRWYLWAGIGCIALFVLSLPVTVPFLALSFLLLTGGSFGP